MTNMWPFNSYREAPRDDNFIARRTMRYFQQPVESVFGTGVVNRMNVRAGYPGGFQLPTAVLSGVPGVMVPQLRQNPLQKQ